MFSYLKAQSQGRDIHHTFNEDIGRYSENICYRGRDVVHKKQKWELQKFFDRKVFFNRYIKQRS